MGIYIIRRLLYMVVVLLFVIALTFLIFYVLPSADPAALRAGRSPTPETLAAIREQLNLDKPIYEQFWLYIKSLVLHFDLGNSFVNNEDVKSLVLDRLPNTLFLIVGAALLWFVSGVLIGTISAIKRGTLLDRGAMGLALLAISAPVYWLGLVALYMFASDIGQFPLLPGAGAYQNAEGFFAKIPTMILPWIVLAAAFSAIYARLTRSNLIEVMSEDRSSPCSASTSASSSAARSSPSPCSGSPASGAWRSMRSSAGTSRRSRARPSSWRWRSSP
jgi:peptide/nickel transport system permease protein